MVRNNNTSHALPDTQQSWWQLTAIQLTGWTSLPILATSIIILQDNSFLGAVLTIFVGNAILWFIRFAIIAMSYKKRQSTLDISRDYLGHTGSFFIALLLLASTFAWFLAQTTAASSTLTHLISIKENPNIDQFTQMSVFLGIICTFLCMEGIVLLRRLATFSFPILLIAFFVAIYFLPDKVSFTNTNALSFSGLGLVLGTNLGITSDMPTFFRHSRSIQDSIKALIVIQIISLAIGIISLYFGTIINRSFEINEATVLASGSDWLRISLIVFVFFSVVCTNVANVYSGSVGWEIIAPSALVGRKEYMILGLGLTTIFVLIGNSFSISHLLNVSDSALVNLCIVLIFGYFIARVRKKLPTVFEQASYFIAWLLATAINVLQEFDKIPSAVSPLVIGLSIIVLTVGFFLIVLKSYPRIRKLIKKLQ